MKQVNKNNLLVGASIFGMIVVLAMVKKLKKKTYDLEHDDFWDEEDFDEAFFDGLDSDHELPHGSIDIHLHMKGEENE